MTTGKKLGLVAVLFLVGSLWFSAAIAWYAHFRLEDPNSRSKDFLHLDHFALDLTLFALIVTLILGFAWWWVWKKWEL